MNPAFLPLLAEPGTGCPLTLVATETSAAGDVLSGQLTSASSGRSYPIRNGIPRFTEPSTRGDAVRTFSYQWARWGLVQYEAHNAQKPMEGHTLRMWERIVANPEVSGRIIGDFGCGSGRFVDICRKKGARVVAIDMSDSVEVVHGEFQNDSGVLVVQGDVLNPPIKRRSLDGAFSIGVLHHTPDPRLGFSKMAASVAPGGWVASAVYGKGGYYDFPTVGLYRALFKLLWPYFGHWPALIYTYFALSLAWPFRHIPLIRRSLKVVFPSATLPDWDWSILDTFDSVTPMHQSAHESYEVFRWYKDAGLIDIEPSDWGFTTFHARIPSK